MRYGKMTGSPAENRETRYFLWPEKNNTDIVLLHMFIELFFAGVENAFF